MKGYRTKFSSTREEVNKEKREQLVVRLCLIGEGVMDGRDNIRAFICDEQTANSGWRTDGWRTEWTLAIIEWSAIELE